MGGIDKINAMNGRYKNKMKTKKWYMRLFYHLMDIAVCSSWFLYSRVAKENGQNKIVGLADFKEELAVSLCKMGMKSTPKRGQPSGAELEVSLAAKKRKPNVPKPPLKK